MNLGLVYLRADVSKSLGLGHISRAIAMAKALERSGMQAVVFCRELDQDQGRAITKLNKHRNLIRKINVEEEFIAVLERKEGKYLFIDLLEGPEYAALVPRLKAVFPVFHTICFDGFFEKELKFDLFVRPLFDGTATAQNALIGLKYYVFSEELRLLAPNKEAQKDVTRVLITLGGSDPFCATPAIVRALCGSFSNIQFTVVIGPGFGLDEHKELAALALQYNNIRCVLEPEHLGHLYMTTDFAITSGGLTKFETALFGIPSLIFGNNRQEEDLSKEFAALGASIFMGSADQVHVIHLKEEFAHLISHGDRLDEMSRKGRQILDIHGGERVIEYIKHNLS